MPFHVPEAGCSTGNVDFAHGVEKHMDVDVTFNFDSSEFCKEQTIFMNEENERHIVEDMEVKYIFF